MISITVKLLGKWNLLKNLYLNRGKHVIPGLETNIVDCTYRLEELFLNTTTIRRDVGEVMLLLYAILMDSGGYIMCRLEI